MCPSATIDINDPELTDVIQVFKSLTKRQAIHLSKLGRDKKAWRVEGCGDLRARVCPNNHCSTEARNCECRTCIDCRPRQLKKWYEARRSAITAAAKNTRGLAQFVYCEIRQPLDLTNLREFSHGLRNHVADHLLTRDDVDGEVGLGWTHTYGYEAGCVMARTLFILDTETDTNWDWWKALWPNAKVNVHIIPIYRLPYFMEHLFLVPFLPKTPEARAEMEVMFEGVNMLLSNRKGMEREENQQDAPFVEESEKPSTNEPAPEHLQGLTPRCHCPKCGLKFTHVTRFMSLFALREVIARRDRADFYEIPPDLVH